MSEGSPEDTTPHAAVDLRRLRALYAACTLLLIVPVWAVHRLPTLDGGCHLYNAFVMHHLHDPAYPLIAEHFYVSPQPVPNWLIQALLYLFVTVLPLALAEKVLVTLYLVLFAAGAWLFAGTLERERSAWAFLALPFAWNLMLHWGFYNFCFSLPLGFLAIRHWWRSRDRLTWRSVLGMQLLLLLTYFAHMVSLVIAFATIGVLWLVDFHPGRWRGAALRRGLLHPLLLLPQIALPLWFLVSHGSQRWPNPWTWGYRLRFVARLEALFTDGYGGWGPWLGAALTLLVAGLLVASLARRAGPTRAELGFVAAGAVALLLYLFSPNGVGMGYVLQQRVSLYPALLVLPVLSTRLGRRTQWATAGALLLLIGVQAVCLVRFNRRAAAGVDAFLAGLADLPRDASVVTLQWDRFISTEHLILGHAIGYLVPAKGFLDWDDYQANLDYFPVRFRDGMRAAPEHQEGDVDLYRVYAEAPKVDVVYTWRMPAGSRVRAMLRDRYRRIAQHGDGILWRRKQRPGSDGTPRAYTASGAPPPPAALAAPPNANSKKP